MQESSICHPRLAPSLLQRHGSYLSGFNTAQCLIKTETEKQAGRRLDLRA